MSWLHYKKCLTCSTYSMIPEAVVKAGKGDYCGLKCERLATRPQSQCEQCGKGYAPKDRHQRYCGKVCASAARKRVPRKCEQCHKNFDSKGKAQRRFCSRKCASVANAPKRADIDCAHCEAPFRPNHKDQRFCSVTCAMESRHLPERPCDFCKKDFVPGHHQQRFCTRSCAGKFNHSKPPKPCEQCQQPFQAKGKTQRFCSRECVATAAVGKSEKPRGTCAHCESTFIKRRASQVCCNRVCYDNMRMAEDRDCPICKTAFKPTYAGQTYCSRPCVVEGSKRQAAPCAFCNTPFVGLGSSRTFCSRSCASKSKAAKQRATYVFKPCEYCQTSFHVTEKNGGRFCSRTCAAIGMREDRDCAVCSATFTVSKTCEKESKKYCSKKCAAVARESRKTLTCEACSNTFAVSLAKKRGRFCSKECATTGRTTPRTCEQCNTSFIVANSIAKAGGGRFCSKSCAVAARTIPVPQQCETCNNTFHITPSRMQGGAARYCSLSCRPVAEQHTKECASCQQIFTVPIARLNAGGGKFCSKSCASKGRTLDLPRGPRHSVKTFIDQVCEGCSVTFKAIPSNVRRGINKYCSRACYASTRAHDKESRTCKQCSATFFCKPYVKKELCSLRCAAHYRRELEAATKPPLAVKQCMQCQTDFTTTRRFDQNRSKFCSRSCASQFTNAKRIKPIEAKTCLNCESNFMPHPDHVKKQRYCSRSCSRGHAVRLRAERKAQQSRFVCVPEAA